MKRILYILSIGVMMCMASCEQDVMPVLGDVIADEVTSSTIVCHCDVLEGSIDACGVYYDTSKNRVSSKKATKLEGTFDGSAITVELTKLTPNKNYYIMAYGMNELGEGNSAVATIKTTHRMPGAGDNTLPGVEK
ncbi:MAG: hypothetical protein IKY72_00770 [Bacteroidaceae bacterium]|nr:hypothetical protein [Bacteroidaceae bacterium]